MEDELKNGAEETADLTGSEDETNKELETKADETAEPGSEVETNEIDYEAELVKERERRVKAEEKIVEMKRGSKKPQEDDEDEDDLINRKIDERVNLALKENSTDAVEGELQDITDNDKERELIKFHYENSIRQSGYTKAAIRQDLERAKLLANESKLRKENSELKEALKAKAAVGKGSSGNNQIKPEVEEDHKFSKADLEFMKKRGLTKEEVIKSLNKKQ